LTLICPYTAETRNTCVCPTGTLADAGCTEIGTGVGVAVGLGVGDGDAGTPGNAVGLADGEGVTGGLVACGAAGFTCARSDAPDAKTHPATIAAARSEARVKLRYFCFVSAYR
jgi:hypothetical protein